MYGPTIVRESIKKQLPCLIEEMDKSTYISKLFFITLQSFMYKKLLKLVDDHLAKLGETGGKVALFPVVCSDTATATVDMR